MSKLTKQQMNTLTTLVNNGQEEQAKILHLKFQSEEEQNKPGTLSIYDLMFDEKNMGDSSWLDSFILDLQYENLDPAYEEDCQDRMADIMVEQEELSEDMWSLCKELGITTFQYEYIEMLTNKIVSLTLDNQFIYTEIETGDIVYIYDNRIIGTTSEGEGDTFPISTELMVRLTTVCPELLRSIEEFIYGM